MTSLWRHSRLNYYDLGPNFLTQGVELLPGEVWQVSKGNSQCFRSYLRKTTAPPPPSGARVNSLPNPESFKYCSQPLWPWRDCIFLSEVGSLGLTWWPGLWWPEPKILGNLLKNCPNSYAKKTAALRWARVNRRVILYFSVTGRRFVNTRFVWKKVRKQGFVWKGSYGIKFVWYKVGNGYSS